MATVTFLQATNMAGLPTDLGLDALSPKILSPTEINIWDDVVYAEGTRTYASALLLGSFKVRVALIVPVASGPVYEVVIDDSDIGQFPNMHITGLSFEMTEAIYLNTLVKGNFAVFVNNLLLGDDTIIGSSGADTIFGFQGNDTLIGGAGGDALFGYGPVGNDTASYATAPAGLFAGLEEAVYNTGHAAGDSYDGIENLTGSAFNDFLYGSAVANILTGGTGNDVLVGKAGADRFDGGTGNDTVSFDSSPAVRADLLSPSSNTGDAKGDAYISIENLDGSAFDDILLGNNNANIIRGNSYPTLASGKDQLFGRAGNDQLLGFDGNDRLDGGLGRDVMEGGAGVDVFDYNAAAETGNTATTRDRITDFTHLTDDIDLSTIDANGAAVGHTFLFLAAMGTAFTGAKGQLRWFQENPLGTVNDKTIIAGDIDGNKVSDFMIELAGLKVLTAADFVL